MPSGSLAAVETRTTLGCSTARVRVGLGDEARRLRRVGGELRAQHLDRDGARRRRAAWPRRPRSCRRRRAARRARSRRARDPIGCEYTAAVVATSRGARYARRRCARSWRRWPCWRSCCAAPARAVEDRDDAALQPPRHRRRRLSRRRLRERRAREFEAARRLVPDKANPYRWLGPDLRAARRLHAGAARVRDLLEARAARRRARRRR